MTTFSHLLQAFFQEAPDRIAVYVLSANQSDAALSYRDLLARAGAYATAYRARGISPGEIVVLILQHGEDLLSAFWGAILVGAIPSIMPFLTEKLSPERYREDLASLISVTRPAAIVTYPEFKAEIESALQAGGPVRMVLDCSEIGSSQEPDFDSLPGLSRSEQDIVLLQHSSGTTGLQKGVALSHKAVLNQLDAYRRVLGFSGEDVVVSWLPLYHDMGLIAGFLMPILTGATLVLMSPFDWVKAPYRLMQAVSRYKGTFSWLPNFAYNFCAQKTRDRHMEGVDLSTWKAVINCSEPVKHESHQIFADYFQKFGLDAKALQTCYAMAENVFGVTQSPLGRLPAVDDIDRESYMTERLAVPVQDGRVKMTMLSSGKPLDNTRVRVLDEKGQEVQDRVIGEIALQSDCMLTGYYNRPDITEKAFLDGWYLTGDFGYFADGELYVTGRKKDMIIVGGKNVYPQDIEALAGEVEGIHAGRTVAFGLFDEKQGTEEVVVVAEAETSDAQEQRLIADKIRQHVTKNSAIALRIVKIVPPRWILKTSSGKAARSANREKYLNEIPQT